jgi:hypothetical protein
MLPRGIKTTEGPVLGGLIDVRAMLRKVGYSKGGGIIVREGSLTDVWQGLWNIPDRGGPSLIGFCVAIFWKAAFKSPVSWNPWPKVLSKEAVQILVSYSAKDVSTWLSVY